MTEQQERQRERFFEALNNLLAAAHKGIADGLYSSDEVVRRVRAAFPVSIARQEAIDNPSSNEPIYWEGPHPVFEDD